MEYQASQAARTLETLQAMRRDLGHAARSLARDRVFTLVCVISLGIGMGAFVALITFNRAITAPAHGIDTRGVIELLVLPQGPLRAKAGVWALEPWSYPDYQALRHAAIGVDITGWARESSQFGEPPADQTTAPPRMATLYVSANYFRTFGVSFARGSGFAAADDAPLAEARVVLSHGAWKTRAASDPDIIGKSVTIDGVPHVVVGVTPENFEGHFHPFQSPSALIFLPLERHPRLRANPQLRDDRTADWVRLHGRLAPGVDLARANALVATTAAGLAGQFPATNEFKGAIVEPYYSLGASGRPESRGVFSVMFTLAAAVLVIVCLNISGMMLVRGTRRQRELSIRAALGAARQRLMQHLFFEALLLAFAGGAISAFVLFGIPAVVGWWIGAPVPPEIDLDAVGVAVSTSLCLLVSVLFGLVPALRFSRPNLTPALKDDAGGGGRRTIRVHRVAAMVQIGIAIPFLVTSGVMLNRVRTADFGFPTDGLAAARLPAPATTERDRELSIRTVRDHLQQASGVRSVALAEGMPIDFDERSFRVARTNGTEFVTAHMTRVGEDYLATIGAPLLRGRTITAEDRLLAAPVAVISQPLADRLFPGAEPIGERLTVTLADNRDEEITIVGVSADFATSQLTTDRPQLLLPLPEVSGRAPAPTQALPRTLYLIVRGAAGDESRLTGALENGLRELGVKATPGVAFAGIVAGPDLRNKSIGDLVAESTAVAFAGSIVLVLAALGIVGVVGFMVATRTREIAVRMALGSTRGRVFGLMLADVVKLVIPGVGGGLVLASLLIRTMENVMGTPLTLGTAPLGVMEPVIYAGASAIAVAVAVLAGLPAARRATVVPPMVAIRAE